MYCKSIYLTWFIRSRTFTKSFFQTPRECETLLNNSTIEFEESRENELGEPVVKFRQVNLLKLMWNQSTDFEVWKIIFIFFLYIFFPFSFHSIVGISCDSVIRFEKIRDQISYSEFQIYSYFHMRLYIFRFFWMVWREFLFSHERFSWKVPADYIWT